MDKQFLKQRLDSIASYQARKVSAFMERRYYIAYSKKLALEVQLRGHTIGGVLLCIDSFYRKEKTRMGWSFLNRQLYILELVCNHARDTVLAMRRWDGIDNTYQYMENY